jgi:hypothetical protein
MSQPRIFVSHSHKDEDFTERLVADLHKAGAEVWVDVNGIQSGNFMQAIDKALAACDWMVLVLSPNAIASDYVSQETYTALHRVQQGYMKAVIPVLVAPCAPDSIPPQWDVLQRYDATQNYPAALAGVLRAVGLAPASSMPAQIPASAHTSGRSPEHTLPAEHFPAKLAELGFQARVINSVEVIIPSLCPVPAGPFLMGSDPKRGKGAYEDEQPQHTVPCRPMR